MEMLYGRLRKAQWTTWAPAEHRAVRDFLNARWNETLNGFPDAGTALCALSQAEDDLGPYLREGESRLDSCPAAGQLRDLLRTGYTIKKGRPRLRNAFWARERAEPVLTWLAGLDARRGHSAGPLP